MMPTCLLPQELERWVGVLLKAHRLSSPSEGALGRAPGSRHHTIGGTQSYQEPLGASA